MESVEEVSVEIRGGGASTDSKNGMPGVTSKPGVVVEETQRGYTMRGKIIRPAKVRIAK